MALKQSSFDRVLLFALVLMAQPAPAQISVWKLGGAGLSWSESDTTRLFIEFGNNTLLAPLSLNQREV